MTRTDPIPQAGNYGNRSQILALQLDDRTNNSSLVLEFEFLDFKRVMLFVGDAQVGNWLSWQNVGWANENTTLPDLLARTIFYKVGHHGSHNAHIEAAWS